MKNEKHFLIEAAGWYGAIAVVVGFFLVSFGYVSPQSIFYLLLNLTGALGILVEARKRGAYPSVFLNVVYALVALLAILKFFS